MSNIRKTITQRSILSLILMFTSVIMCAQIKISGVVKDNTGETMPGVSVMVKGTTTGVVTDVNGLLFPRLYNLGTESPTGQVDECHAAGRQQGA